MKGINGVSTTKPAQAGSPKRHAVEKQHMVTLQDMGCMLAHLVLPGCKVTKEKKEMWLVNIIAAEPKG